MWNVYTNCAAHWMSNDHDCGGIFGIHCCQHFGHVSEEWEKVNGNSVANNLNLTLPGLWLTNLDRLLSGCRHVHVNRLPCIGSVIQPWFQSVKNIPTKGWPTGYTGHINTTYRYLLTTNRLHVNAENPPPCNRTINGPDSSVGDLDKYTRKVCWLSISMSFCSWKYSFHIVGV